MKLEIRAGTVDDSRLIAELTACAGDGIFDALLHDLVPGATPVEMLTTFIRTDNPSFSWRNAIITEVDGKPAGLALCYPAANTIARMAGDNLSPERLELMRPFEELLCPESFYLCAIAVLPAYRRHGLGRDLLDEVSRNARLRGFPSLSLHVFEDNREAIALYEHYGFRVVDSRPNIANPRLRRNGKICLMLKAL